MNTKLLALAPATLLLGFVLPYSQPEPSTEIVSTNPAVESYSIDSGHSGAIFKLRHFGASNFYGRFNQVGGSYQFDRADMTKSSVKVEIDAKSIDTNGEKRDAHLRTADFFAVEEFPQITFESTKIEKGSGKDEYVLTGDLNLHGVTKSVQAELSYIGEGDDAWGGFRTGFEAKFVFKRSDFGMSYYLDSGALGDEISVTVFIEGVKQ